MSTKSIAANVKIDKLKLDIQNPRFAELYSGSDNEEDLIEYLLYNESAKEVVKAIINAGEFYPDRPLWVIQDGESYIVKDGNRRCSAIKALQNPEIFNLDFNALPFDALPVLIYENVDDLNKRILEEHTNSVFKEWDRISKALQTYKLFSTGKTLESMQDIDSNPSQLIKLASFYYEAVKLCGEDLKKLLRRGRGETGGKTIIFERLFSYSEKCGYKFHNKPSYKINVFEKDKFESYVKSLVAYLQKYPNTKTQDIDLEKENFFDKLIDFGFLRDYNPDKTKTIDLFQNGNDKINDYEQITSNEKKEIIPTEFTSPKTPIINNEITNSNIPNPTPPLFIKPTVNRKSIKEKPTYTRKKIPAPLEKLIKECYLLDSVTFPNAKTALTRVVFECTLKYIIENTKYNDKKNISDSSYFRDVFFDPKGNKRTFTDFTSLKKLFTVLIMNTGDKKAFENFDLDKAHQIIHNYKVAAIPDNSKGLCDNLISLIEFMLQEESELLQSLDLKKLN